MRYLRTCAQLSVISAVLPLAARAASSSNQCPLSKTHPFASIRFSNQLFQSPFKSKSSVAAEPESGAAVAPATHSSDVLVVYVTVPDMEHGKQIAHHLVKEKLAACCNIIPGVTSVYEWEGAIEEDSELLMMIKTTQDRLPELTAAVQKLHTYDECEVVAVPVAGGSATYLQWVQNTVAK